MPRVCLVTGGGSGVGLGAARALTADGATVVLSGRSAERLAQPAEELGADTVPCELSGESAPWLVGETLRRHGRLDVVVHAAGNQVRKPTLDYELADWDAVLDVHLRAAFTLSQAALRHMQERGSGVLVFVGSMTSSRLGHPSTVGYAAAKSGLLGLARTLAVEFAASGIRVNTVVPGFVRTDMAEEVIETPERRRLTERIPQGRYGTTDEVGSVVAFLASDAARYVTGETLTVDGGWSVA